MAAKRALLAGFLLCLCRPVTAQTAGASGSMIEGDVVDGDTGKGIPGTRVKLGFEQDGPWFTFTDGAGHFRFTGLAGKRYWIAAQQIGFMGPNDRPQSHGGGPSIQPGQTEPVRIVLIRYAVIAGVVTDSSGAPVPNSAITVMRKTPVESRLMQRPERRLPDGKNRLEWVGQAFTDQRGAYRIARLRPGTYYVVAQPQRSGILSDEQRTERGTYYGGALDFDGAKPIEAAAGGAIANVNIQLLRQAGVRVSGQIAKLTSQEGASSEGVYTSVGLQSLSGESANTIPPSATVMGDRFEIKDVLPGKYTLTVSARERHGRPEADSPLTAAIQNIEVGQTDLSGLTVALQPPHDLPGTVRFDASCHPGSVRLSARPSVGRNASDVTADADGSFVLKNLPPSRYSLNASIQGDGFATLGAVRLGGRESQDGFLMTGEDYGPLLVEIVCPRGNVSGQVMDASGAPAKNAMVALVSPVMPGNHQSVGVGLNGGRFNITVRPGAYDVYVCSAPSSDPSYSRDCQKAAGPLTVEGGTNSRLVLALPAGPRKEGSQ